jgi:anti-sigma factor RsiW
MLPSQPIEELLSGFLDGELSEEERLQIEALLTAEPSVGARLESLRQLQADLRQVPQKRLSDDFSARVIEAARRQAIASQLPADHHVLVENRPSLPNSHGFFWTSPARFASTLAVMAASILLIAFLANQFLSLGPGGEEVAISGAEAARKVESEQLLTGNPLLDSQAAVHSQAASDSDLAMNEQPTAGVPSVAELAGDSRLSVPVRSSPGSKKAMAQAGFQVLLVYDFKVTQAAWDANVLGTILENSGIHWTSPIFASEDVTRSLEETRSIVRSSSDREEVDEEDVAIVFVSASARALDQAIGEIWQRSKDFPFTALDMAFDRPDQDLLQKLSVAMEGRLGDAEDTNTAAPIVLSASAATRGLDDVAQFSMRPRDRFITAEERNAPPSTASFTTEEDFPSWALLVVRKPSK